MLPELDPAATPPAAPTPAPVVDPAPGTPAPAADPAPGVTLLTDPPAPAPNADDKPALTAEEQAAADTAAKALEVPENYEDFAAPENVKLDEAVTTEFKALAKDLKLPQAQAQQVVDLGVKMAQNWQAQQADSIATTVAGWASETTNDPELGGDKLNENLAVAKSALTHFGSPKLAELLNQSGLGNHPELIRLLHKVGKATTGDTIDTGRAAPTQADKAKAHYPNSNMN